VKKFVYLFALASLPIYADSEISYDYIEAGYRQIGIEKLNSANTNFSLRFDEISGDAPVFEGSISIGKNRFIYADLDFSSFMLDSEVVEFLSDFEPDVESAVRINSQALGLGYHTAGNRQWVVKGALLRRDVSSSFLKEASIGFEIELGFRFLFNNNIEWEATVGYADPDGNDGPSGTWGGNSSIRYHFSNNISTDISASTEQEQKTYGLNVRYNFD